AVAHGDLRHEAKMARHQLVRGIGFTLFLPPLGEHELLVLLQHRELPNLLEITGEVALGDEQGNSGSHETVLSLSVIPGNEPCIGWFPQDDWSINSIPGRQSSPAGPPAAPTRRPFAGRRRDGRSPAARRAVPAAGNPRQPAVPVPPARTAPPAARGRRAGRPATDGR